MKKISAILISMCLLFSVLAVIPVTAAQPGGDSYRGALTDDEARSYGYTIRLGPVNDPDTLYYKKYNDACWAQRENTAEVVEFTLINDTSGGWSDYLNQTRHWTFDLNGYTFNCTSTIQPNFGITMKNGTIEAGMLYFHTYGQSEVSSTLENVKIKLLTYNSCGLKINPVNEGDVVNVTLKNVEMKYMMNDIMIFAKGAGTGNLQVIDSTLTRADAVGYAHWNNIFLAEGQTTFNIDIQNSTLNMTPAFNSKQDYAMAGHTASFASVCYVNGSDARMNLDIDEDTTILFDSEYTVNNFIYAKNAEQYTLNDQGAAWTATPKTMEKGISLPTASVAEGVELLGYSTGSAMLQNATTNYKATVTENITFKAVYYADGDITNVAGAAIRLTDPNGIRFTANVEKSFYEALGGAAQFGTLIVETAKLGTGDFTHAALGDKAIDVVLTKAATANGDLYQYRGAMLNLENSKEQYNKDYSATAYVKITYADGTSVIYYADYVEADNSRSLYDVAAAAQADYANNTLIANIIAVATAQ